MPHLVIEFSANVGDVVDIDELVAELHDAALTTGIAPLDALRTRAAPREHYAVADRHPDNMFIAVTARFGAGRSVSDRKRVIDALLGRLDSVLGERQRTMMLSVEYQEIDPASRVNKNNLRPIVAERTDDDHRKDGHGR